MFKGTVIGRLGQDPQSRTTRNDQQMCTFTVASNRRYTNAEGEREETTTWISCAAYRRRAEIIQENLKKGNLVYLRGEISTRDFVTREGKPGYSINMDVEEIQFLQARDQSDGDEAPEDTEPEFGWDPESGESEI